MDVPAADERLEHQVLLVGVEHLLGANHECDLAEPGLDLRERLIEPGRARAQAFSTLTIGIVSKPIDAQRALAANGVLVLHDALAGVGEPRGLDVGQGAACVGKRQVDRLACQILHRLGQGERPSAVEPIPTM